MLLQCKKLMILSIYMSGKEIFMGNAELFAQIPAAKTNQAEVPPVIQEPVDPRVSLYNALNPYIEKQCQKIPGLAERIGAGGWITENVFRHVAATYGTIFELGRAADQQIENEEISGGRFRVADPVYDLAVEQFSDLTELTKDDIRLAGNIGWQALQDYRAEQTDEAQG
jgi:hypothetical protein